MQERLDRLRGEGYTFCITSFRFANLLVFFEFGGFIRKSEADGVYVAKETQSIVETIRESSRKIQLE
jgi:hypothetical protein